MKKILLFLILLSSLYSDSDIYIGSSYGYYQESLSVIGAKSTAPIAQIKFGYGDIKSYAIEFSLDYLKNHSKIFSSSSGVNKDGDKIGFNVELLKAFDFDTFLYPYIKVGFGTGFLDIKRELQNSLTYGSFNLSTGAFIPIYNKIDLEVAYEYRSISYQAIDNIANKQRVSSTANIAYIGFNLRF